MQNITQQPIQQSCGLRGVYTLTLADVSSREAQSIQASIVEAREAGDTNRMNTLIRQLNNEHFVSREVVHNLIPTVGRSVLAQRLANTTTYTGIINKVALGTGSTAAANGDTQLGTEVYRNNASSLTYADNIAYITGFFTAAETNGTYNEVGLFIDGTASANTGQLFSRSLISVTKSSIQTLTVDWIVTIS